MEVLDNLLLGIFFWFCVFGITLAFMGIIVEGLYHQGKGKSNTTEALYVIAILVIGTFILYEGTGNELILLTIVLSSGAAALHSGRELDIEHNKRTKETSHNILDILPVPLWICSFIAALYDVYTRLGQ